jgi:hypothetical protein
MLQYASCRPRTLSAAVTAPLWRGVVRHGQLTSEPLAIRAEEVAQRPDGGDDRLWSVGRKVDDQVVRTSMDRR